MSNQSIKMDMREYEYDDNGDVKNSTLKQIKIGFSTFSGCHVIL